MFYALPEKHTNVSENTGIAVCPFDLVLKHVSDSEEKFVDALLQKPGQVELIRRPEPFSGTAPVDRNGNIIFYVFQFQHCADFRVCHTDFFAESNLARKPVYSRRVKGEAAAAARMRLRKTIAIRR